MVEMSEVANILNNATENSLIVLDEIGRGTSTFDGLSIARAIIEYIANDIKAKTLVATHYHELIELEHLIIGVKNYCVQVKEIGKDIVFLHKIAPGGSDKSYGVQVSRIAGVPDAVLRRATEILEWIGKDEKGFPTIEPPGDRPYAQRIKRDSYGTSYILEELDGQEIESISPERLKQILINMRRRMSEGEGVK